MTSSGTLARGCSSTRNFTAAATSPGWRIAARRSALTGIGRASMARAIPLPIPLPAPVIRAVFKVCGHECPPSDAGSSEQVGKGESPGTDPDGPERGLRNRPDCNAPDPSVRQSARPGSREIRAPASPRPTVIATGERPRAWAIFTARWPVGLGGPVAMPPAAWLAAVQTRTWLACPEPDWPRRRARRPGAHGREQGIKTLLRQRGQQAGAAGILCVHLLAVDQHLRRQAR